MALRWARKSRRLWHRNHTRGLFWGLFENELDVIWRKREVFWRFRGSRYRPSQSGRYPGIGLLAAALFAGAFFSPPGPARLCRASLGC